MCKMNYRKALIFMLLLLTFAVSYQAGHQAKAAGNEDFFVIDGKLIRYYGDDKNVIIPEGITCIGDNSEEYYSLSSVFGEELETVSIPSSVTTIARYAFNGCTNLKEITIPETITAIDEVAFSECTSLKSVTIPQSVTSIGFFAFGDCTSLKDVEIKGYGVKVGARAFSGTPWLEAQMKKSQLVIVNDMLIDGTKNKSKSLTLPSHIRTIAGEAFFECKNLVSIKIPDQVNYIGSSAFERCSNLKEINLPSEITSINFMTFCNCRSLEKITIPKKVKNINSMAFYTCSSLKEINFLTTDMLIEDSAFKGTEWLYDKQKISPMVILGNTLIDGSRCTGDIVIPDTITRIGYNAFYGSEITSVIIPDSVKIIDNGAFACCEQLKKVELPETLTTIETYAFYDCISLTSIIIPDSVTYLGSRAFMECTSLENIKLSPNIKRIYHWTFGECKSLKKIVIPNSVTVIEGIVFDSCTSLEEIYITDSVIDCSTSAFDDANSNLTIYTMPNAYAINIADYYGFKYKFIDNPSYSLSVDKISVYTTDQTRTLKIVDDFGRYIADDNNITWKSSNEGIVKVTQGSIIPVKKGKADIIASYQGKEYRCQVTVVEPSISNKKLNIPVGENHALYIYGFPTSDISWKSSNKSIATVSKTGVIQTKKTGQVTITATVNGVKYSCSVFVYY